MKIGIDLDNVLADFSRSWLLYHNKKYDTNFSKENVKTYNMEEMFGNDYKTMVRRIKSFYRTKLFSNLNVIEGSRKTIKYLQESHKLFIITSRPSWTEMVTRKWVYSNYQNSFQEILISDQFGNKKNTRTKIDICKDKNIDIMVEDAPSYTKEVSEGGIKVILLDQPWNQDVSMNKYIKRAYSWEEIKNYISMALK